MDNAKLFIDYLISDEVQQQFGDNLTIRPIIASISSKTLPPSARFIPSPRTLPTSQSTRTRLWSATKTYLQACSKVKYSIMFIRPAQELRGLKKRGKAGTIPPPQAFIRDCAR